MSSDNKDITPATFLPTNTKEQAEKTDIIKLVTDDEIWSKLPGEFKGLFVKKYGNLLNGS